jgi:amino acid permease
MIICIALIIMILQLSALMNVLDNEIKPIVQNIQETTSTLRGTAEFVSTNVTKPVIRAHAFVTGALSIMREISGIRNALRQTSQNLEDSPLKVTEANPKPETKETKETPVKEEVKETPTPKVDKSEEQKNGETKSD